MSKVWCEEPRDMASAIYCDFRVSIFPLLLPQNEKGELQVESCAKSLVLGERVLEKFKNPTPEVEEGKWPSNAFGGQHRRMGTERPFFTSRLYYVLLLSSGRSSAVGLAR